MKFLIVDDEPAISDTLAYALQADGFAVASCLLGREALAAWFVLTTFVRETEPGIRQATEETLVDSAHLLAEMAALDLAAGRIAQGPFTDAVRAAVRRSPQAEISGVHKESIDFRVYVTDAAGIVVYDSQNAALGEDFSHWRDIARVLIGVLSLAKPMASIAPYVDRAARRVKHAGLTLLAATAAIGLFFSGWLSWLIHRLRAYARAVADGRKAEPPTGGGHQFSELARALAQMREKLEGKQYVENYVQNLAHEMKSPLTAVIGAAEILEGDPPAADRRRFADHIGEQARRLQAIIERMLMLARVEQLQVPEGSAAVDLGQLLETAIALRQPQLAARGLTCHLSYRLAAPQAATLRGDGFLLQQAVLNQLDNAIEFSPEGGSIEIALDRDGNEAAITLRDHGAGAPDYALAQLFERFYSLPRPATGRKSTGLGLARVREVARLHGGEAGFANHPEGGGVAWLKLPVD